jgi:CRP-like cAMP-binding protein
MKGSSKPSRKLNHTFMQVIPKKYHAEILQHARILKLKSVNTIFHDNGKAEHFYLILKGRVNILTEEQDVRYDPEPRVEVLISLGPGNIVGWSWIIPPYRWRFEACARESHTEVLAIDGKYLREKCAGDHELAYHVYKKLVPEMNKRLIASRMRMAMFGGKPFANQEGG